MTQPFGGGAGHRRRSRRSSRPTPPGWRSAAGWSRSAAPPTTAASCGSRRRAARPPVIYRHAETPPRSTRSPATTTLLVISHSEHGDPRYPALRVAAHRGRRAPVAEKWDGEGRGLHALEFGPRPGRPAAAGRPRAPRPRGAADLGRRRRHRDRARARPARRRRRRLGTPTAPRCWSAHDHAARSELYRYDLATGALERLDTPPGVVRGLGRVRPDGTVESGLVVVRAPAGHPPPADGPGAARAARRARRRPPPGRGPLGARPGRRRARAAGPAGGRGPPAPAFLVCTAARTPPTTTPTAPAARPTSTPASRSCT